MSSSQLTNSIIFQRGSNQQPDSFCWIVKPTVFFWGDTGGAAPWKHQDVPSAWGVRIFRRPGLRWQGWLCGFQRHEPLNLTRHDLQQETDWNCRWEPLEESVISYKDFEFLQWTHWKIPTKSHVFQGEIAAATARHFQVVPDVLAPENHSNCLKAWKLTICMVSNVIKSRWNPESIPRFTIFLLSS